ncbi:MAG: alpha-2-macroglobulin family protein, partial [Chthoniobacterales bacterium]
FYLGINRGDEQVVALGAEIPLQVVAVQPDGKPVANPVEVKVDIWRWRYNVVRELGAGGAMTFRSDKIEEPVFQKSARTLIPTKTNEGWTVGKATSATFKAEALGHHRIRVSARDAGGREVVSESSFYVSGDGDTVWDYRNPYAIDLVPDKTSYLPGETAKILVQTPIEGEAMVNVQRGDAILRTMRVPLSGNAPVIEIPLENKDAPNVTVTAVILRGADESRRKFPMPEFRFGSCTLAIEQPQRELKVAVTPEKARVQPGDDVACVVEVRDHENKPVSGAGVTFYAVDDGVVSLVGFTRPEPGTVFLQPVADRVLVGLNLADFLPEDPDDLEFSNKGYLIGGGGAEGPVALRDNFPGTACWLPSLVTGADGRVNARFTAPDALTRYRIVAVAAAGTDSFGSAESSVEIAKPLMLLPSLGQFANEGDDILARAVIRNQTGADGDVEVTLTTPTGTQNKTLRVANGASSAADFTLNFAQPGGIDLQWTAKMNANGQ